MRAAAAQEFIPFWPYGERWHRPPASTTSASTPGWATSTAACSATTPSARARRAGGCDALHAWHLDGLARLFPEARFVGMVRHPGGNVASAMTRLGLKRRTAARRYARDNRELVRQAAALGERCVLLRYEDLVTEPSRSCASCSTGSARRGRSGSSTARSSRSRAASGRGRGRSTARPARTCAIGSAGSRSCSATASAMPPGARRSIPTSRRRALDGPPWPPAWRRCPASGCARRRRRSPSGRTIRASWRCTRSARRRSPCATRGPPSVRGVRGGRRRHLARAAAPPGAGLAAPAARVDRARGRPSGPTAPPSLEPVPATRAAPAG